MIFLMVSLSNIKLFADDSSIFSTIHDISSSASNLNFDLEKISEWDFKWKIMFFNPDPTKQAEKNQFFSKNLLIF